MMKIENLNEWHVTEIDYLTAQQNTPPPPYIVQKNPIK